MMNASWTRHLDEAVAEFHPQIVAVRRHLHAHPEVSGEEFATTAFLRSALASTGLNLRTGKDGRGLVADLPAEDEPFRIAIRGDMDALRIQEGNHTEYRSTVDGVMHACGHDGHTAVVFGAAMAIARLHDRGQLPWPAPFRAIFQPAEETNLGALEMIDIGALEKVRAIFSLHMDPSREVGTIGLRSGVLTADCDEMRITIQGRGGHAARPHESLDPIAAAAQLISSLYLFVPRSIDMFEPAVVTIGRIHGGENCNVIPDEVTMGGTIRSIGGEIRRRTLDHVRQLAAGLADVSGTRIEVKFIPGPDSVVNDPELTDILQLAADEMLGPNQAQTILRPSMGGEDFANYLVHVPGAMFRLGCAPPDLQVPRLHSPEFDLDERSLGAGARVLAHAVVTASDPARSLPRPPLVL
jgi:amidohydrolase